MTIQPQDRPLVEREAITRIVDGWLDEQEGFGLRRERLLETLELGTDIMPWLYAAFELGASLTQHEAKLAAPTEELVDTVMDEVVGAYLAGAQAVHEHHDPDGRDPFPEFGEAADDYAASRTELADHLVSTSSKLAAVEAERANGWLYVSDDGPEWSENHPIESGEVPDARLVRPATTAALVQQLKDFSNAHNEALSSEARSAALRQAAEARVSGLVEALEEITQCAFVSHDGYWNTGKNPILIARTALQSEGEGRLRPSGCINHPDRPVRENLDGDNLCQECCDAWARAEGDYAARTGDEP